MDIDFKMPTSWEGPIHLDNCLMTTCHINEITNDTEDCVAHNDIDEKYKKYYQVGEVFSIGYDLEILRNAFPKNGRYIWIMIPCVWVIHEEIFWICLPLVEVDIEFTLGKREIINGESKIPNKNLIALE